MVGRISFRNNHINGTAEGDLIVGSNGRDKINGRAGDDVIYGYGDGSGVGGNAPPIDPDGGGARDHDFLNGGRGNDTIYGGGGNDILIGGDGDDVLFGGSGHDVLFGNDGNDALFGGSGNDLLFGGRGDDVLSGGEGHDVLHGGQGDDRFHDDAGEDLYVGGRGFDTLHLSGTFDAYSYNSSWWGRSWNFTRNGETDSLKSIEAVAFDDGYTLFLDGRNNASYAVDDVAATDEDSALQSGIGELLGNDLDFEGDAFAVTAVNGAASAVGSQITLPSGALLSVSSDGTFSYDPNAAYEDLAVGESRLETFQYSISDGQGGGASNATVTITVSGANDAPTVAAIVVGAVEDGPAVTAAFAGADVDSDDDAASLDYTILTAPSEGAVIDNGDGTFTFDPGADFQDLAAGETRDVSFDYIATDSHGADSASATVTITVTGTDDGPTAGPVGIAAIEDGAAVTGAFAGSGGEGSYSYALASAPAEGAVIDNGDGTFTFDPGADFQDLAEGETRNVSFDYTATDAGGAESPAGTVTVTVTGTNDAPTVAAVSFNAVEDGPAVNAAFGGADIDSDDGQASLDYTPLSAPSEGTVFDNGDGTFTFDPGADFQDLAEGETRDVSFDYRATDSHNAQSQVATATITVTGVNDAPTVAAVSFNAVEDGPAVNAAFAGTDIDSDDDQASLSYSILSAPSEGTVLDNGDGTFTFDPGADFQDLAEGETRDVSFDYRATDSHGIQSQVATATITVTGVNDAPTVAAVSLNAVEDGAAVNAAFAGADIDSDDGQASLDYTPLSAPSEGTVFDNGDGTFTFDPGADFQDLAEGETRDVSFDYRATDGHNAQSQVATATITVTGVNDAPTVAAVSLNAVEDGAAVNAAFAGADIDSDDDQASLSYSILSAPSEGAVIDNGDGTFSFDPGADFQDLAEGETRDVSFDYRATDSHGIQSQIATVTVTVTGVNDSVIELSDIQNGDGSQGFVISGIAAGNFSGRSASGAGDVNGDGFDDVIVGAYLASPGGQSYAGESYVVFGSAAASASNVALSDIRDGDGSEGFVINGIDPYDYSGFSVSGAGDVNGDGFDDVIVGAFFASPGGQSYAGESYVVFGRGDGFAATIDLSAIEAGDGSEGFVVNGADFYDYSGISVSGAGDVNGDGIDDLLVGAFFATPDGRNYAGESYVVFGRSAGFSAAVELADIENGNGTDGFVINGINSYDLSGVSVSDAGDVNGDGIDDLVIGASEASPNGQPGSGQGYVVFGRNGGFPGSVELSAIESGDGSDGFVINGVDAYDWAGFSVSGAGDVNGDGFDDILIGAPRGNPGGLDYAGESFVIFGRASGFSPTLNLADIQNGDGSQGFMLIGANSDDTAGMSVSGAGDVNGDGFDDLLIGAVGGSPDGRNYAGESYVVFGRLGSFGTTISLSDIEAGDGNDGFVVRGIDNYDASGTSVSAAGDVNGDGFDDLLIGAPQGDPGGQYDAGESYVVFGRGFPDFVETLSGGPNDDVLAGGPGNDTLSGGAGDDRFIIFDGDGDDIVLDFVAGAGTDDVLDIQTFAFAGLAGVLSASTQIGDDVLIALDADDSVTLLDVQLADLHGDDFIFS